MAGPGFGPRQWGLEPVLLTAVSHRDPTCTGPSGDDSITQEVISPRPAGKALPAHGPLRSLKSHLLVSRTQRRHPQKLPSAERWLEEPTRVLKNKVQKRKGSEHLRDTLRSSQLKETNANHFQFQDLVLAEMRLSLVTHTLLGQARTGPETGSPVDVAPVEER